MANPTPPAITWIKNFVAGVSGGWTNSNATLMSQMNALNIPNPVTQSPQLPIVMAESALSGLLSGASLVNVMNWVNFGLVKADIDSNNHTGVAMWGPKLNALNLITASEATAIENYANSTTADPSWSANISPAQENIGRQVDDNDLTVARSA